MLSMRLDVDVDEDIKSKQCLFVKIKKQPDNFIMSSFDDVQDLLFLSYEGGMLDEDEFSLLHEKFMPKKSQFLVRRMRQVFPL